jgi:hypothetical protein
MYHSTLHAMVRDHANKAHEANLRGGRQAEQWTVHLCSFSPQYPFGV